ncbi:MAG: hypothetical protein Q4F34_04800 [Prevotellaceae bacterium]|nr:hypothetical protein [Prevotellaceae bacterium]
MKILHVILDDSVKKNLINVMRLTDATSPYLENHLVTNKHVNIPNAEVIQIYKSKWNPLSIRNTFLKQLYALMPDVVHVHGGWNYAAYQCLNMSRTRGFLTFFTPYGELSMKEIKNRLWQEKIWKLLFYQRPMLKKASYVIVQSQKEGDTLYTLGRSANMEIVPNDSGTLADRMVTLYRNASDDQRTKEVSMQTLTVIHDQLHELIHSRPLPKVALTAREVKQYNLFCMQQRFVETITDSYEVPRYNDGDACEVVYKMTKKLKSDLSKKVATFNDIFQLAATIQNNDYDEDRLVQGLQKDGLLNFLRRAIQVADELCGIEPGFMPCLPLNDAKTLDMKLRLFNQ